MKSYKEFDKRHIGDSDKALLTVISSQNGHQIKEEIHFGKDACYQAYECFGDVEIGEHYDKVFDGEVCLTIIDDFNITYQKNFFHNFDKVSIYRAKDMGCIIHWHN